MKRTLFVLMLSLATVVGMAQHRGGHGPRGHEHHSEMRHEAHHMMNCASPEQVAMVLHVLENQSFEDKKLEVAKLCTVLASFTVRDLASMAAKFTFDDKRKEFLIFAYRNCYDPENYYLLRDSFSFRSNFDEMMEAVLPGYKR